MTRLRVLVVDDEAPARKRLRDLVTAEPGLTLVGACEDGPEAVDAIRTLEPDLLFLDVQMPEMDGFEVLRQVGVGAVPFIVFVTAHDRHALAAFDARAIDYLLKPFTRARFREAVDRARGVVRSDTAGFADRLQHLLDGRGRRPERIALKDGANVRLVRPDDVDWIEADGNYVRLHSGATEHRVRATLKDTVRRLERHGFARIHQSYVVNLARVRELRPWSHGELVVVLEGGKTLVSSRTYAAGLRSLLDAPE